MKKLSLLLAMCLLLSAALPAWADSGNPFRVEVGRANFDFPANPFVTDAEGASFVANYPDYMVLLVFTEWGDQNIDYTWGDVHMDNMYMLLYQFISNGNAATSKQVATQSAYYDFKMADGNPVLLSMLPNGIFAAHYYDGTGFLICVMPQAGKVMDANAYVGVIYTVAQSFTLDGVTADDMAAGIRYVVVTADECVVTGANGAALRTVHRGDELRVIYQMGERYVVDVDGKQGFLSVQNGRIKGEPEAPAANTGSAQTTTGAQTTNDAQTKYVVITSGSGKIRTEASLSGALIRTAYKGEKYELIRQEGDWYVVKVDGRTGYIHKGVAAIQ